MYSKIALKRLSFTEELKYKFSQFKKLKIIKWRERWLEIQV